MSYPKALQKIILGTVQFGIPYGIHNESGKPTLQSSLQILEAAKRAGIPSLDSSAAYGDAHKVVAEAEKAGLHFEIFTKFILDQSLGIRLQFEKILADLSVEKVSGLSFHRFDDLASFQEWPELLRLKADKKIGSIGASIYTLEQFEFCVNHPEVELIQIPFNLLDHSKRKCELMAFARSKGKKIHVRSIFLQGLFFMDQEKLPHKLIPLAPELQTLHSIAKQNKMTMRDLAFAFVFQCKEIDGILFGVEQLEQLNENLDSIRNLTQVEGLVEHILAIQIRTPELLDPSKWN